jgi:hypothetical protein
VVAVVAVLEHLQVLVQHQDVILLGHHPFNLTLQQDLEAFQEEDLDLLVVILFPLILTFIASSGQIKAAFLEVVLLKLFEHLKAVPFTLKVLLSLEAIPVPFLVAFLAAYLLDHQPFLEEFP